MKKQYLEEAEELADHIAILHEGKIIASGTLAELKKGKKRREEKRGKLMINLLAKVSSLTAISSSIFP